jgi:hypothetical protein
MMGSGRQDVPICFTTLRISPSGSRLYLAKGGQIVDAIIIQAPRQRNNQEEKDGEIPQDWKEKSAKLARYILFPSATCQ